MIWVLLYEGMTPEHLGYIPDFLDEDDPRPASVQINEKYIGGWSPMHGFNLKREYHVLEFPGDPPMRPVAMTELRDEMIFLYPYSWLLIENITSGVWEVARID